MAKAERVKWVMNLNPYAPPKSPLGDASSTHFELWKSIAVGVLLGGAIATLGVISISVFGYLFIWGDNGPPLPVELIFSGVGFATTVALGGILGGLVGGLMKSSRN